MKDTGKHGIVYGLTNSLSFLLGIVLVPIFTRAFDPREYGILALILLTLSLLFAIFSMCLNAAFLRYYLDKRYRHRKKEIATTSFITITAFAVLLAAMGMFTSHAFSILLFGHDRYWAEFLFMFVGSSFQMVHLLPMTIFRAEEKSLTFAAFSTTEFVTKLVLNIYLIVWAQMGIMGVILGRTLPIIVLTFGSVALVRDKVFCSTSPMMRNELLRFGAPLVLPELSFLVMPGIGKYLLSTLSTLHDVGLFTLASQVASVMWIPVASFAFVFGPMKYKLYGRKGARQYFVKVFTYYMMGLVAISVIISLLSIDAIRFFAGSGFWGAYVLVPMLCFGNVFYGLTTGVQLGVVFAKRTEYLAYIIAGGMMLNIVISVALIPLFGMMGAALANLVTYIVIFYLEYVVNQRFYHLRYEWGRLGGMAGLLVFFLVVGWFLPVGGMVSALGMSGNVAVAAVFGMLVRSGLSAVMMLALWFGPFLSGEEKRSIKRLAREILGKFGIGKGAEQ